MQRIQQYIRPKVKKKLRSINKTKIQLLGELSMWDREKNDFYHTVEKLEKFDMYTAYLLIKKLNGILRKRRKVKNELRDVYDYKTTTLKKEMYRNHIY